MAITAAQFGMLGSAKAETSSETATEIPPVKPGTNTSFISMKQIDAGLLNVGYAEAGPAHDPAVILHNIPQEAPQAFAQAVIAADRLDRY